MRGLRQDLRFARRGLRRNPAFTAAIIGRPLIPWWRSLGTSDVMMEVS
jgi:hypothetical protein